MLKTESITSLKDPRVVEARELTSARGRRQRRKCLLEGAESLQWALEAHLLIEQVFYHAALHDDPFLATLHEHHIPCYAVTEGLLKKISGTSYLIPYLGVAHLPQERPLDDAMGELVIILDRVLDHGNLGTIIRTATAFGVRDLVLTDLHLDLYFKKIVAASRGKVFEVHARYFPSGSAAIAALKGQGYQVVATSPHARDLQAFAPLQPRPVALIVGNETEGVADDILQQADVVVQIPMSGPVESLNVGVATGISLYELKCRMVLHMLTRFIRANFGREVNVTAKMILLAFDRQIKQVSDLNGWQVLLLMILTCDQRMTMEQVGKDLATFGPALEALLAPLFRKAYIEHAQLGNEEAIYLTETGERALAQLWSVVERAENQVLSGFSESERKQLATFLQRIQANCVAMVNEEGEGGERQPS
jgi:RNA methyltransferase, TrmH family